MKTEFTESEKESILKKQLEVALSGDVAMLIWLGKQYLNQVDVTTRQIEGI